MSVDYRRVAANLEPYYVYVLIDPRPAGGIFYVGKGTGQRYGDHLLEADALGAAPGEHAAITRAKVARIREIRSAGLQPRIDIVRRALDEKSALEVEAALIDCVPGLTNRARGHGTIRGRLPLAELESQLGAPPLTTQTPALLIKLNDWVEEVREDLTRLGYGYRSGMSDAELYASTRGIWKVSRVAASKVSYAVAVYAMVTRAVWEIDHAGWEEFPDRKGNTRHRWTGSHLTSGQVWQEFCGPRGRRVPDRRPGGRWVFGNQATIAYWP